MIDLRRIVLFISTGIFMAPALIGLAQQTWQTEAGSLSPIVLTLGFWTLWSAYRSSRAQSRPGNAALWVPALILSIALTIFASAIDLIALVAVSTWAGCVVAFYALTGRKMVQQCAVPLIFLGMIVPLPYSLSVEANAELRSWLSHQAVWLGHSLGLDAALENQAIIVEQYVMAVENACAGTNSTLSLIAIGILFAYWVGGGQWLRVFAMAAIAIPIAMIANVLRVLALMAAVSTFGSGILETAIHPASGLLSFIFALLLLFGSARLVDNFFGERIRACQAAAK